MTTKVIFILSTNYAGSHLLSHLLGAHSQCASIGELHNYMKFKDRGSRSRNVVDDYQKQPAFHALEEVPVRLWHETILQRLQSNDPGLNTLVDNSKRLSWCRQFGHLDAHYVHLLRDPRALVNRWLNTYTDERQLRRQRRNLVKKGRLGALFQDDIDVLIGKWLTANEAFTRFIERNDGRTLSYRDLACATRDELTAVQNWTGLGFEPAQLAYGRAATFGTRKADYVEAANESRIDLDLRWQAELADATQQRVSSHKGVNVYLASIGYAFAADGITSRS